jgi:hypothetical protein
MVIFWVVMLCNILAPEDHHLYSHCLKTSNLIFLQTIRLAWRVFNKMLSYLVCTFQTKLLFSCSFPLLKTYNTTINFPTLTFLSGNLLALLNKINSSNRKTWRRHFFPFCWQTRNSFCRSSLPCSLTFTCWYTNALQNNMQIYTNNLKAKHEDTISLVSKSSTGCQIYITQIIFRYKITRVKDYLLQW